MPKLKPAIRREIIMQAALAVCARPGGWSLLTRAAIAAEAQCSEALVSRYLGDMRDVRRSVMREAIRHRLSDIILQSVVAHDGYAARKDLRRTTLKSLLG